MKLPEHVKSYGRRILSAIGIIRERGDGAGATSPINTVQHRHDIGNGNAPDGLVSEVKYIPPRPIRINDPNLISRAEQISDRGVTIFEPINVSGSGRHIESLSDLDGFCDLCGLAEKKGGLLITCPVCNSTVCRRHWRPYIDGSNVCVACYRQLILRRDLWLAEDSGRHGNDREVQK